MTITRRTLFWRLAVSGFLLKLLLGTGLLAQTDSSGFWREDEQRLSVGAKLFPAFLGALEDLEQYRMKDGSLRVLVLFTGMRAPAMEVAARLAELDRIRGIPLKVQVMREDEMSRDAGPRPAAIFVASFEVDLKALRSWSERHRSLVFSPFSGAVEAGAIAGIYVADRILPYVNARQAARAHVRFKPFFLQVARRYEGG
ncbi:hypothetical protein G3480_01165 [Thiorhodococcus mannitoliphagus]|uniref:YfiR family protein n=1 Tax=Thiorhodococcus mannitoliphagus TaxID=329406 RepID=A0A6P1DLL8_9GAMM|nr:hypothetical protein [Thiorhodococcus mannitoliphagus]NEX18938.1 hypothetical protein [Thiorhodococcus mannitoliphagus]